MFSSVTSSSILLGSATGTAVRAIWVIALAFLALWIADRMKPATPRRPVHLQVDHSAAPLYREPGPEHRRAAATRLGLGAIGLGAIVACLLGIAGTLALEILGRLLRG